MAAAARRHRRQPTPQPRHLIERVPDDAPVYAMLRRHPFPWTAGMTVAVTEETRAAECLPEVRMRFDMMFMPLATVLAATDPVRRAKITSSVLVSPLQGMLATARLTLLDILGPVMQATQEELGMIIACVYMLQSPPPSSAQEMALLLCFTFDVLPTGATTNDEAPVLLLAFCAAAAAGLTPPPLPSLCFVPWIEGDASSSSSIPCPRARTEWTSAIPTDVKSAKCWSWAGAALVDPNVAAIIQELPLTHYVPVKAAAAAKSVEGTMIEWPSPLVIAAAATESRAKT